MCFYFSDLHKNCPPKRKCVSQHVQYLLTPETRFSVLRIFSCPMSFSSQSSWPGVVEWQVATAPPQPSSYPHGWSHHQASVQVMAQVQKIVGRLMLLGWWDDQQVDGVGVRDGNISWSTGFRSTHHHPSG